MYIYIHIYMLSWRQVDIQQTDRIYINRLIQYSGELTCISLTFNATEVPPPSAPCLPATIFKICQRIGLLADAVEQRIGISDLKKSKRNVKSMIHCFMIRTGKRENDITSKFWADIDVELTPTGLYNLQYRMIISHKSFN